ncbi:hypothetical protein K1719_039670 [Acacia pycnantha]|nr:hypothetical protein K1719_039670 [Acacia pycnantha]
MIERRTSCTWGSPQGNGNHRIAPYQYGSRSPWQKLCSRSFGPQLQEEFQWICGEANQRGSQKSGRNGWSNIRV